MKSRTAAFTIFCCVLSVHVAHGQHSDIAIYQNAGGQVTLHDTSTPSQHESTFFARDFDFWGPPLDIYAGDDPGLQQSGLNPPTGYSALPGEMTIEVDLLPLHIPGVAAGNILFWDGVGPEVTFAPIPNNHVLFLEDSAGTEVSLDGSLDSFVGLVGGITDPSGGVHEHLIFSLENGGNAPMVGFYAMGWQVGGVGLDDSRLTPIVLQTPSIPSSTEQMVDNWLTNNANLVTAAGDFNADGNHTIEDVDALVAEIVAGNNDPAFDLDGDGSTDNADLTLWREIAGSINNPSGGAYLAGDADLDGVVDGQDFLIWNDNKFTNSGLWSLGDFTADGTVDGQDFLIWNDSKFQSADERAAVVPEPASGMLMLVLTLLLATRAREII